MICPNPKCMKENTDGAAFCVYCGKPLPNGVRPTGKSAAFAAILSAFLPGLGQFYNNDFKKGLLILVLAFVAGVAIPVTLGSLYLFIWLWGLIDAYRVAKGATPIWA